MSKTKESAAKAETPQEEKAVREELEKSNVGSDYEELLNKCEQARDICATEFWQDGFQTRFTRKKECYENLLNFMKENKPEKLEKKKDLAPFNGLKNKLVEAVIDFDAYTRDAVAAVEEMQHFLGQYRTFKDVMPKKPIWDNQKGVVTFQKNI